MEKLFKYILKTLKSFGFVGGVVGLLLGPLLVVYYLKPGQGQSLYKLIENAPDDKIIVGLFIFIAGIAVLLDQSSFKMFAQLRSLRKAEKRGLIDTGLANLCRIVIMSQRVGEDMSITNTTFKKFIKWIEEKKIFQPRILNTIESAWDVFNNSSQEE